MKRKGMEALGERLFARGNSRLSCDQPELQKDLKMAAGLILLLAKSPDVEVDVLPSDRSPGHLRIRPNRVNHDQIR